MSEIRFYHLERQSLDQALPALVSKAYENGHRLLIKTADERQTRHLDEVLWTFHPNSFLPHGTEKDGYAEDQPIYLTDKDENPNKADVLILTHGASAEDMEGYSLICEMFDGRNEESLKNARSRWKTYKDLDGFTLTYWQQTEQGWQKKEG